MDFLTYEFGNVPQHCRGTFSPPEGSFGPLSWASQNPGFSCNFGITNCLINSILLLELNSRLPLRQIGVFWPFFLIKVVFKIDAGGHEFG